MEHLKKFNESNDNKLDFDQFKYIMSTVEDIDSLTELNYEDSSDEKHLNSYECWF